MTTQSPIVSDFQALVLDEILHGVNRLCLLPGGRFGGKTFVAVLALMLLGSRHTKSKIFLGGTTYENIRANCEGAMEYWAEKLGYTYRWPEKATNARIGDQTWEIKGLQRIIGKSQVQGRTYAGAFVDEATEVLEENFKMLYTSVRAPGSKIIMAWNPDTPEHWVQEILIDQADEIGATVMHSTMHDNPYAEDKIKEALQNRALYREHEWNRLILGLPARAEGLVYPFYNTTDFYDEGQVCYASADYGESSVTTAHYYQRNGHIEIQGRMMPKWAVVGEYYYDANKPGKGKRTSAEHAREIKRQAPGRVAAIWVDPSARDLKEAMRKERVPTHNGYNKEDGYDITNGMLQSGIVEINEVRCPNLTTTIKRLVYNKQGKPDPNCEDHCTDDLRYGLTGFSELRKVTR